MVLLETISTGDRLHRFQKSLVLNFIGKRKVLSTSPLNGGYQENLQAVFNNDCKKGAGIGCVLKAPTYEEHMEIVARELGLDPTTTAGLGTAACMENVAMAKENFRGLEVTAIVTGGVEINGGRVGDPADYWDWGQTGKTEKIKPGTINTILVIDANLSAAVMTRALITATEAKTAALQELMAGSNYSTGLATGSGTDGTIIVSNADSPLSSNNAGKHSKLGELIGKAVKKATQETLYKQTGLGAKAQYSAFARLKRYGITEEKVWQAYLAQGGKMNKSDYWDRLPLIDKKKGLLPLIVQLIHLLDELNWGLLDKEEVLIAGEKVLQEIGIILEVEDISLGVGDTQSLLLERARTILAQGVRKND